MRTQLETLGEEFKLAGKYLMERAYYIFESWTLRCIGIVRTMATLAHLICLRVLWWCFGIVKTIPTSSSSWPMDHTLDLMVCFYHSWDDFDYLCKDDIVLTRLWSTLWIGYYSGRKTSAIQMSNRTFYSPLRLETVRCYLYVENWFGERTLCSDDDLYSEEGCTDTLCESLHSWEVSHKSD